eukprot:3524510-Alexandrium_andersonii.AAC.1
MPETEYYFEGQRDAWLLPSFYKEAAHGESMLPRGIVHARLRSLPSRSGASALLDNIALAGLAATARSASVLA